MRALSQFTILLLATCLATPAAAASKQMSPAAEATPSMERLLGNWPDETPDVSLSLEDDEVGEAIGMIAELAGWHLVLKAPDSLVEQEITLEVEDVPAAKVLAAVLETGNLRAKLVEDVLIVTAAPGGGGHAKADIELPFGEVRVTVRADHHDDERTSVGGDVTVAKGEVIEGDVVAVGGSITIRGRVEGDAVAVGGSVILEPGAVVEGDANAIGGEVVVPPGARVEGDRVSVGGSFSGMINSLISIDESGLSYYLFSVLGTLVRAVTLLVLALLLIAFIPERVTRIRDFISENPGHSTLGGLGIMIGFVPMIILLAITLIGIPLIPIAVLLLGAVLVLGLTAFCTWLGFRIPLFEDRKTAVRAMLIGLVALTLIDLIPIVGTAVVIIVAFISAGAVLLTRFGKTAPAPRAPDPSEVAL